MTSESGSSTWRQTLWRDAPGALYRRRAWAVDLLALLLLLGSGWRFWPGPGGVRPPGDLLLSGPDAAAWAQNAIHLEAGRLDQLDFHRMPTYTLLVAAGVRAGMGAAAAGHLVNHLSMLILPVLLYGLGRAGGSRAAGLGAGLMIAINPFLLTNSRAYGVDPLLTSILPAMMLAACVTARCWWFGPLSGALAAFAAAAHYTTLAHILPPAILVLLAGGPGWRRFAGFGLHAAAGYAVIRALFSVFPFPDRNQFMLTIQEGAAAGSTSGMADTDWSHLRALMEQNGSRAVDDAIRTMIQATRPDWLPWDAALALPWIGIAGLLFSARTPRLRTGVASGLALLLCLGPLPFLAMAHAPERYSYNLIPFVLLLQWRGAASLVSLLTSAVSGLLSAAVSALPSAAVSGRLADLLSAARSGISLSGISLSGVVLAVAALRAAAATEDSVRDLLRPLPPPTDAQAARQIGEAIARHFPPGGGVAVPLREAAIYASREYCPRTGCPFGDTDIDYRRCVFLMERECGGEGPMAYVVLTSPQGEGRSAGRIRLDAWVKARWPAAEEVRAFGYAADIIPIPREEARALVTDLRFLLPQPGTNGAGPVPPPPGVKPPPVDPGMKPGSPPAPGAAPPGAVSGSPGYVPGTPAAPPSRPGGGAPPPGPVPPPPGEKGNYTPAPGEPPPR